MNNPNLGKVGRHFQPGQSGNPSGKPKGTPNRSTIAKKILEMPCIIPDNLYDILLGIYPDLNRNTTIENLATLVQASKAISRADVNSYKAVMDSAYGAPKQAIEMETIEPGPAIDYDDLSESALQEIINLQNKTKKPSFEDDELF